MDPTIGFVASLAATLALLAGVVLTGVRARVRAHLFLVACSVTTLGVTIVFAKSLGEHYDLAAAGTITPVHLALAKLATAAYLLPIASGIATLRDRRHRRLHLRLALLTLALTVLTAITGTWMLLAAEKLD